MYEPKLPVTGASFLMLGINSFFQFAAVILLILTFSLVFFRLSRLLVKEGKIKKILYFILTVIFITILFWTIGKCISNLKTKDTENLIFQYNENISIQNDLNDKNLQQKQINYKVKDNQVLGVLEIEKISLKLPIIEGENDENLWKGSAHIKGTPLPWKYG